MLQQKINTINDNQNPLVVVNGRFWNDFNVSASCHNATLYCLYWEAFNQRLNGPNAFANNFSAPTQIIGKIQKRGNRIYRSNIASLTPPGTVIIFVRNDIADHSCIVLDGNRIGGYNQTVWFRTPGNDHAYSDHAISDLDWDDDGEYVTANTKSYELWAVPAEKAIEFIRYPDAYYFLWDSLPSFCTVS